MAAAAALPPSSYAALGQDLAAAEDGEEGGVADGGLAGSRPQMRLYWGEMQVGAGAGGRGGAAKMVGNAVRDALKTGVGVLVPSPN